MTAKILLPLGILFSTAGFGWAEPLGVFSGEHANFTRLVTPLSDAATWEVEQRGNQIFVTIPDHEGGFETGSVFDRIPRDRIAQMTSEDDQLTLDLACDCTAASFVVPGPYLVIDVAETGVTLEGDPIPQRDVVAETSDPAQISPPLEPLPAPAPVVRAQVIPLLPTTTRTARPILNFPQPVLDRADLQTVDQETLAEMQDQLARELGGAATAGVLTPAPGRSFASTPAVAKTKEQPPEPEPIEPTAGPLANVRISSSLDRPTQEQNTQLSVAGLACPPQGAFDVSNWGTSDPFAIQIGNARDGLYGELDRLDHRVATQLAQRYLYFGFGAEARQILELDPALAQKNGAMLLIADILDGHHTNGAATLLRNPDCDPDVILWATLAQPEPVQGAKPDTDAALRSLSTLPVHLRQIIAPLLSQKLLAFGDADSAAQALRSLQRQPDPLLAAAKLAEAELDLHTGNTDRATAQLEEVADENTAQSPAALITLVDAKIQSHQPIEFKTAELLAAYAHELRDTEQGPPLRRAHVLALLMTGQFDAAFEASRALGGAVDTESAKQLRQQLLRELTASADDIVFLEHVFAQTETDIAQLSVPDLNALARRFFDVGFPERAERTLGYIPQTSQRDEDKLLAAEIALVLGKPQSAQASLLGVEGDPARRLRADAKRMAGAHSEAHELYLQTAQTQTAAETAWLADNWQGLTPPETPIFGAASQLAEYVDAPPETSAGMLERSATALDESAAARQTLTELLEAEALQVSAEN